MKFILSLSGIILIWALSMTTFLTSCTKDKTIFDTVTVIKNDTLILKDTVVTKEILASHPWKLQELRGVNEGSILYYLRGGISNTNNYDIEYYNFADNQTGLEFDNAGITRQITDWKLNGDQMIRLTFTYHIDASATMIITWDNLRYKNKALYYDEYYSNPVTLNDFHGQGIRIAK